MGILAWIVFGLIVGLLARAIVPGRQHMGLIMTTLLGVAGSLLGGFLASVLTGTRDYYLGAIAVLLIAGAVFGRRTTRVPV
jgi:uncharacterized membrane protein YeaQ/YmgE (transglycosylase-associated protein family)